MTAGTVERPKLETVPELPEVPVEGSSGQLSLETVPELPEVPVEGSSGQLSLDIGGKAPTTSSLRLMGGKVEIAGEFYKGETVVLRVECRIGELGFIDQADRQTGQVVGCERQHKARIVGVRREV